MILVRKGIESIGYFEPRHSENPLSLSRQLKRQRIGAGASAFRPRFERGSYGEDGEERLAEKCGVFGVYGTGRAAALTLSGLHDLQHRGQGSSGIATSDGKEIFFHKDNGLVAQVFYKHDMQKLPGHIAIGHDRYATSHGSGVQHAQPIVVKDVGIALAHNGNLSSTGPLENFLQSKKIPHYRHLSDSGMIAAAVAIHMREGATLPEAIKETYPILIGAFSILAMDKENLVAFRDRCGIRPLSLGTLGKKGRGRYVFSSETCAFPPINATHIGDVQPGEMIVIGKDGMRSVICAKGTQKLDIFEFIYFARPDSVLLDQNVYMVRRNIGSKLAKEYHPDVDMVIPIPQTAIPAAVGYSEGIDIPFEPCLIKGRDRRTFIDPEQQREQGVRTKLAPIIQKVNGKRIVLIDDSIVEGTTSRKIVAMMRDAGAKEVHFGVASPPIKYPDFYGIHTPNQNKLIGANKTPQEIRDFLRADSLHFLSLEGLVRATNLPADTFSMSCFTGEYLIDIGLHRKHIRNLPTPVS